MDYLDIERSSVIWEKRCLSFIDRHFLFAVILLNFRRFSVYFSALCVSILLKQKSPKHIQFYMSKWSSYLLRQNMSKISLSKTCPTVTIRLKLVNLIKTVSSYMSSFNCINVYGIQWWERGHKWLHKVSFIPMTG